MGQPVLRSRRSWRCLLGLGLPLFLWVGCSQDPAPEARSSPGGLRETGVTAPAVPPGPEDTPPQSPEAWALLDAADALTYSARDAGLKDITYLYRLSTPEAAVAVSWVQPNHVLTELSLSPNASPAIRTWAEATAAEQEARARRLNDLVVGRTNREEYEGDELQLVGPREIKILARSERSRREFEEARVVFGDEELPVLTEFRFQGTTTAIAVVRYGYAPNGKRLLEQAQTRVSGPKGEESATMTLEYQSVGPYTLPSRIRMATGKGESVQEITSVSVDRGVEASSLQTGR